MAKHKLQRYAENETFKNLFQHNHYDVRKGEFPLRGKWHTYFGNHNPIILELGCGRGEYTVAMAKAHPDINFIGIDVKGARIWRGCKDSIEQNLTNTAFIRSRIDDIEYFFAPGEVREVWITFPDPQPKRPRHRLMSPNFVSKYKKIWGDTGILHLKTDSRLLYDFIHETAKEENWLIETDYADIYHTENIPAYLTDIQTFYEKKWLKEESLISYVQVKIG